MLNEIVCNPCHVVSPQLAHMEFLNHVSPLDRNFLLPAIFMGEFTFNFIAFSRTIKIALSHNIATFTRGKLFYFFPKLYVFLPPPHFFYLNSFVTHRNNHKNARFMLWKEENETLDYMASNFFLLPLTKQLKNLTRHS